MTTTKKRLVLAIIVIAVLITLTLAVYYGIQQIPSISEQIPPQSNVLKIRITHPDNQTGWPKNYPVTVQTSAWGAEPITYIEFFINGVLYDTQSVSKNTPYDVINTQWKWQPGDIGTYLLTARAVGAYGSYGISDPVLIESFTEYNTGTPIEIIESSTFEQIANDANVSLVDLQNANPGLPADHPVQAGEQIFIPNLPEPVTNDIIPAFNPQGQSVSYPDPNQTEDEQIENPPKWNKINDLQFLIKNKNVPKIQATNDQSPENQGYIDENNSNPDTNTSKLPLATDIFGNIDGCNVNLYIQPSYQFSGAFIYRSRDGSPFERIATIPQFKGDQSKLKYTDENQSGVVSYYAAVFNTYGENPGPAKVFPLDQTNCSNKNNFPQLHTSWLEENGDLSLMADLDTAYLYVQINDNQAERVPEGNRMFLPNSGVKFNINTYLESRDELMTMTDFNVHMEIWGWQGGELRFVGNLDHVVHRSVLLVCDTEGEGKCSAGSLGNWDTEMTILPHIYKPLNEQKYELRWLTSTYSYANKVCIGIGEEFNGPGLTDSNPTILKLCFNITNAEDNQGNYLLDFGKILYPEGKPDIPPYNGKNENYQDPDFKYRHPMGDPFSLAIRVLPIMEDSDLNDISNTVHMHHLSPYEQEDLPPMASTIPSLYDIEILENTFKPQEYEIPGRWACVIIDANAPDNYHVGQEVCPLTYVQCGVNVDCEDPGFFGSLEIAWNLVADTYNDAKGEIAGAISDTIPYCDQSSACQHAVRAGVDYGVTALTGMPPNLPNSDELVAQGVSSAIIYELNNITDPELVEYICGDTCEAEIESQVKSIMENTKSYYSQPGCFSYGDHYGFFPVCFGPPTVVHPVYGAYDFPGYVFIRVTRKTTPESLAAADEFVGKTQLWVTVDGKNSNRIGYYGHDCHYSDNIPVEKLLDPSHPNSNANRDYGFFGDEPMQGQLYKPVQVEIPWLEPGESMDIPVSLYVLHNKADTNCITTTKSQYLFYRGTSHMEAAEYCRSEDSSQLWVPCTDGGMDIWDYENPSGPGLTDAMEDAAGEIGDAANEALQ